MVLFAFETLISEMEQFFACPFLHHFHSAKYPGSVQIKPFPVKFVKKKLTTWLETVKNQPQLMFKMS